MSDTVFYSWQSDLPNRTNRTAIERSLERAISALGRDADLDVALRLDQDTRGVPGSPDIGTTILEKIERAAVFVCDVSLVNRGEDSRPSPNPNVLVELGYALKALGAGRVIMAFNTHYGRVEDLPFDLRLKRALTYKLAENEDAKEARDFLKSRLESALKVVFDEKQQSEEVAILGDYLAKLAEELISFLIIAEQMPHREQWLEDAQYKFLIHAEAFRDLAIPEQAESLGVARNLRGLAKKLDEIGNHRLGMGRGSWEAFLEEVQIAVKEAHRIKSAVIDTADLGEESRHAAAQVIRSGIRRLTSLAVDAREELASHSPDRWQELKRKASEEGASLLRLSYFDLSKLGIDSKALKEIAMKIHQIELLEQYESGRHIIDQCLRSIDELVEELRGVIPNG